jgi:hypothetical protein
MDERKQHTSCEFLYCTLCLKYMKVKLEDVKTLNIGIKYVIIYWVMKELHDLLWN